MDVVILGGHGKIALLLARQLTDRGDRVRSIIRNADQADDIRAVGAEPVVYDVELRGDPDDDLGERIVGADAVVFAAGAGAGSGVARKWTVDRDGALKLAEACKQRGVSRYVLISAWGAVPEPSTGDEVFDAYLRAKWEADERVSTEGLEHTVLRPVGLTDEPGAGTVTLAEHVERGQVSRADVAAVVVACLDTPGTIGKTLELTSGTTPIADAVAQI